MYLFPSCLAKSLQGREDFFSTTLRLPFLISVYFSFGTHNTSTENFVSPSTALIPDY
jgi:hypothetical protein